MMRHKNLPMKKILIIDDDPKNIFALVATLKSKGYPTVTAEAALEGLKILDQDDAIGIVLMDMMLPEIDGYEATAMIRDNPARQNIPVIAVTAQAMPGDKEKCIAAGANDYISKPIDVGRLFALLDQYLAPNT
jgi:CheY-like chemotaxis protein